MSLRKYYVEGGFNDEVMADLDFVVESSIELSKIFHITPGQVGSSMVIIITWEGSGEEEEGEKLTFRAGDVQSRGQALEGLYQAFKKRRRIVSQPTENTTTGPRFR